jgi:hypothetical protein
MKGTSEGEGARDYKDPDDLALIRLGRSDRGRIAALLTLIFVSRRLRAESRGNRSDLDSLRISRHVAGFHCDPGVLEWDKKSDEASCSLLFKLVFVSHA